MIDKKNLHYERVHFCIQVAKQFCSFILEIKELMHNYNNDIHTSTHNLAET